MIRIGRVTPRFALVALLGALGLPGAARAEETRDPAADLRRALGTTTPATERLAIAQRIAAADPLPDPDAVARLAVLVLTESLVPSLATTLLRRAVEQGLAEPTRALVRAAAVKAIGEGAPTGEPQAVDVAGFALVAGVRRPAYRLLSQVSSTPAAREGARLDAPEMEVPDRTDARLGAGPAWERHVEMADLLDAACADDPRASDPALTALLARKADALSLLLAVAGGDGRPTPPGLVGRRARAITVLGMCDDRRATPVLAKALDDAQPGWVRVAAAYALGDLGDPAALPALTRALFYLGDRHRPRDSWDYHGAGETDVPAEEWADVDYHAIDVGIADALLRLGVPAAAEWLIRERLDPRKGRWRVRVPQDATDAIRRAFPDAPADYRPDAGLPERMAAFEAYLAWWGKRPKPRRTLAEGDPATAAAVKEIVAQLGGKSVMELQIAKASLELLGPAATAALAGAVPASKKVERTEIARVLATVRDPRAVDPLVSLTADEAPGVRAAAAEALAAYVEGDDGVRAPVLARLIAMLDDADEGPRAAALGALAAAPPNDDVRAALAARGARPENAYADWKLAERVVRLVHTGEGVDDVLALLADPALLVRRKAWGLLRVALRLPASAFDPGPPPGSSGAKPLDAALVREALARRRSPK